MIDHLTLLGVPHGQIAPGYDSIAYLADRRRTLDARPSAIAILVP
jgi:hypothetical protein